MMKVSQYLKHPDALALDVEISSELPMHAASAPGRKRRAIFVAGLSGCLSVPRVEGTIAGGKFAA